MPQYDFEPGSFLGYSLNMSEGGEPLVSALIDINKFDNLRSIVRAQFCWNSPVFIAGGFTNLVLSEVIRYITQQEVSHGRME